MSLRMDDINQKENAMKLSMQTVDFRLAKLEEMALQTSECLFSMQQVCDVFLFCSLMPVSF